MRTAKAFRDGIAKRGNPLMTVLAGLPIKNNPPQTGGVDPDGLCIWVAVLKGDGEIGFQLGQR